MKKILSMLSVSLLALSSTANAADHLDSPSVEGNGQLDLTDLYAFQSPTNSDNAVFILGVNPGAGVISPDTFSTEGVYNINIDNDGDAVAEIIYSVKFSRPRGSDNSQRYYVYRLSDSENAQTNPRPNITPTLSRITLLAVGTTGVNNPLRRVDGMVHAGVFEDPFFFDLDGFNDNFQFTGDDFFAGLNISAVALELPRSDLGGDNVAVWASTETDDGQVDRVGRPAISTALIVSDARKDAFNAGSPATDFAEFGDEVESRITFLNGGDSATAASLTAVLLPDVLTVDFSSTAGFLNGRQLTDDVIDAELDLLTNGAITTDGVNQNDVPFPAEFPYLAGLPVEEN